MRRIGIIAWKEMLQFRREPRFQVLLLIFPIVALLIFGYLYTVTIQRIPLSVRDFDQTAASRRLVRELLSTAYFVPVSADPDTALDSSAARVVVEVPPQFAAGIARGEPPALQVMVDGVDLTSARAAQGYIDAFASGYRLRGGDPPKASGNATLASWFNPEVLDTRLFVPGAMAICLCAGPIVLTALSLVREKQGGTWVRLRHAPVGDLELLVGRLLPYVIFSCLLSATLLLIGRYWFGLPLRGSMTVLLCGTLLFVLAGIGLGAIIASMARDETSAWQLITLLVLLPALVLSGFIYPPTSMPPVAQVLSHGVAMRPYLDFLRSVMLKGAGLEDVSGNLWQLAAFAAGGFGLAVTMLWKERQPTP